MNIHEYQAKQIFAKYGVPAPRGFIANTPAQALKNAQELGGKVWVVKAQIHAGGRGLGGGVKIVHSLADVKKAATELLGMTLVTHQTGPMGKLVQKVYVEEGIEILDELYLSIVLDRALEMPIIMALSEGGTDIETVAQKSPEKIIKIPIDPDFGYQAYQGRELISALKITDKREQYKLQNFVKALYNLYIENDVQMVEINPLVKTKTGSFLALDAKMQFDDSAMARHPHFEEMRDIQEEDPDEREASLHGLSYISLEGEIACMVNGAGLAMGTMDTINYMGGKPANFLDVGGNANPETVAKGFEIILRNKNVKAIFINIFGGIVRCDRIALGIIEATITVEVNVPIIVRLDGTNADEASFILEKADIKNLIIATDIGDGARKAVEAAKKSKVH
ncbi:ADP-forming succinate--CoA ligase subunit beta [Arcobacteraceae bacterium]|nr:ADP-forming succinate--CoA ligase subunit beta [Arcobacteraceae bacterium]